MKGFIANLLKYLHPDRTVLDEPQNFDSDLSCEFFRAGDRTGCVVLHGIGGTPANVRVVADALAEEGYTVLAPVLPGHRKTVRAMDQSSWTEWLSAAEGAYDRLQKAGCVRIYMIGLSLGGILSGIVAEEKERPVAGAVLICAPVRMQAFLHLARLIRFAVPTIRYGKKEKSGFHGTDPAYSQMYGNGFSTKKLQDLHILVRKFRRGIRNLTCPVLFFSAKYDNKVAPSSGAYLQKHASRTASLDLVFLENSPHGCTYGPERDLVAKQVREYVKEKNQAG